MINSVLLEALNEVFKSLGFRKKSANWYRVSGDLYCIVGVQESRWDESCYVNVGFTPAVNVEAGWLPESKCLVRFRADAITSISREDLDLLSGEAVKASGEDDLRVGLLEKIANPTARAVDPIENMQDLKSLLRTSVSDQVFIHREIRGELLEEG
ncbi:DUF4304 domain-containing protein [Streptomyces sp. CNQ431]|uniref:DUF4304 domain-containing protein n=1 Tax=Streptomyces sp. CNQ431 TaxID=1571532 RepID=UPI00099C8FCA|nr:DUF4304 domain-containing protein [Streptomyces sp. CNQ431]